VSVYCECLRVSVSEYGICVTVCEYECECMSEC
jgi:hypothetical protein